MKQWIMLLGLILILTGCQENAMKTNELTATVEGVNYEETTVNLPNVYDQSVALLKHFKQEENILLSPLSIDNALGMAANGANGETAKAFGDYFKTDLANLNQEINSYNAQLTSQGDSELHLANSVWLRDDDKLTVQQQFLEDVKNAYQAQIFEAPFNRQTVNDVNEWVSKQTKDRIPSVVDQLDDAQLLLINALAFDATWQNEYKEDQIDDDEFTTRSDEKQTVPMMFSKEYAFIEDADAIGFEKPYKDKFSFIALLPKEKTVTQFIETLTPEQLKNYLTQTEETLVYATLPKFKTEFSTSLVDYLKHQHLENAFDPNAADFTRMASIPNENLFIGNVIHKTMIDVDELGTKAGAVTAITMEVTSAPVDFKEVNLNRPFVYAIIDTENRLPIFIGVLDAVQ